MKRIKMAVLRAPSGEAQSETPVPHNTAETKSKSEHGFQPNISHPRFSSEALLSVCVCACVCVLIGGEQEEEQPSLCSCTNMLLQLPPHTHTAS